MNPENVKPFDPITDEEWALTEATYIAEIEATYPACRERSLAITAYQSSIDWLKRCVATEAVV